MTKEELAQIYRDLLSYGYSESKAAKITDAAAGGDK